MKGKVYKTSVRPSLSVWNRVLALNMPTTTRVAEDHWPLDWRWSKKNWKKSTLMNKPTWDVLSGDLGQGRSTPNNWEKNTDSERVRQCSSTVFFYIIVIYTQIKYINYFIHIWDFILYVLNSAWALSDALCCIQRWNFDESG